MLKIEPKTKVNLHCKKLVNFKRIADFGRKRRIFKQIQLEEQFVTTITQANNVEIDNDWWVNISLAHHKLIVAYSKPRSKWKTGIHSIWGHKAHSKKKYYARKVQT